MIDKNKIPSPQGLVANLQRPKSFISRTISLLVCQLQKSKYWTSAELHVDTKVVIALAKLAEELLRVVRRGYSESILLKVSLDPWFLYNIRILMTSLYSK